MSNYNTMNPVPSIDPRDLDDNATVFDLLLQSTDASVPDRLGVQRKTWSQMEIDAAALVSPNVSALAAVTPAVDKGVFFNAVTPVGMGTYTLTSFSRSLGAAVDGAAFHAAIGTAPTASALATARSISATGDAAWTVNFNGSANVTAAITLANVGSAGTYGSVTTDAKGRVTAGVVATSIANGGTGQTTQAAALTAILGGAPLSIAEGGTGLAAQSFANFSLQNSWTVVSSRRAAYRKVMDNVQIEMQIINGTATDGTLLATLPVGFRPASLVSIPVISGPNATPSSTVNGPRVNIATDGQITCANCSSVTGIFFVALIPLV